MTSIYGFLHPYSFTILTIIPAFLSIFLAFWTREVVFALFVGIMAGGIVLALQTGSAFDVNILDMFLLPSLGSMEYAVILVTYLWCLGGMIGMWHKTGAAKHFAETIGVRLAGGPRSAMFFTWVMGLIFHQGGTVSTILTGTTVKPVTDRHRVSHEELAYIVDSTASPVATILPFNAWPLYVGGIIIGTIPLITNEVEAFQMFIRAIPFNFYSVLAVLCTLLLALEKLPWLGAGLAAARTRARTTGKLDADDAQPLMNIEDARCFQAYGYTPHSIDFILPILILLSVSIIPYALGELGVIRAENANWIGEAFALGVISSMVLAKIRGMSLKDIMSGFVEGCQGVTIGAIILGFAVALSFMTKKIGLAPYLVSIMGDFLDFHFLPLILTALCLAIAFSTGSSFGTFAVVLPVAMPLAYALCPDPLYIQICLGSILGGSVAGDQCSPVSDTTVLSSMTTGCDLVHHVKTQLPVSMVVLIISALLSTACTYLVQ